MSKPVIFFGVSDFAKMLYVWSENMDIDVAGFMADDEYCSDEQFCGLPVWKTSSLNSKMTEDYDFLVCVGYKKMRGRKAIYDKLARLGCRFINFIYPTVTILPEVKMGVNNILLSDVTIENNVIMGNNNVLWSKTLICHDTTIGNHNFFAPRVSFAGNCKIGNLCFFGISSFAINNLIISDETYLIAGSGLFKNTKESTRYGGNPAREIDSHKKNGICIL